MPIGEEGPLADIQETVERIRQDKFAHLPASLPHDILQVFANIEADPEESSNLEEVKRLMDDYCDNFKMDNSAG